MDVSPLTLIMVALDEGSDETMRSVVLVPAGGRVPVAFRVPEKSVAKLLEDCQAEFEVTVPMPPKDSEEHLHPQTQVWIGVKAATDRMRLMKDGTAGSFAFATRLSEGDVFRVLETAAK